jgi:predicted AAA+ superfamily ATPase
MKSSSQIHHRNRYINKVEPFIGKNLIKVFTGQRRVGKSYLLFQIIEIIRAKDSQATICYINKEDLSFDFIKTGKDLHDYVMTKKQGKTYVFIDEIQDIDGFELGLRSLALDEELDLYCTGSNANLLSGDIAGYLSGRYIETVVYSLSYDEFLDFHNLKDQSNALEKYMTNQFDAEGKEV